MKIGRALVWIALLGTAAAGYAAWQLLRPYAAFEGETFIDFPKGTSTETMADLLTRGGVIRRPWPFVLLRALRRGETLKAGEYRFNSAASTFEVFDRIARGDIFYYELTVPEGKNMFDIAAAAEKMGIFSAVDFLAAARDPALIRDLDRAAPSLEGYLFPSTYRLTRHSRPAQLCEMMTAHFRDVWRQLEAAGPPHAAVTLASMIEREARVPRDRPLISSVFHNRLDIGMKLDCDPTTIYAALLEGRWRGAIHRSDLESPNPYNTYRNGGLPPGPICNPGRESLEAALHPVSTNYLYFVARPDGSGAHNFSRDIAAHLIATAQYHHAADPEEFKKTAPARVSGRPSSRPHR